MPIRRSALAALAFAALATAAPAQEASDPPPPEVVAATAAAPDRPIVLQAMLIGIVGFLLWANGD